MPSKSRGTRKIAFPRNYNSKPSKIFDWQEPLPALLPRQPRPTSLFEKLRGYQQKAVAFALSRKGAGLFCDPRTGKTWIAIGLIDQLQPEEVLAVVPLTNKLRTWDKLLKELLPHYGVYTDFTEYRKAKEPKIFLIHYEQLAQVIARLVKRRWGLVIVDEAQRIKDRSSKQSRHLRRLRHAEKRLALSGTPIDAGEADLWGQMRFIEPLAFSDVWSNFDSRYLRPTGFRGFKRKFKENMRQDFEQRLRPFCLRISREEAELPSAQVTWVPVSINGKQDDLYREMEEDWIATINEMSLTAKLEITKRVKLQQITGGFLFDEDKNTHWVGRAKERKLRHLLRSYLRPPALVFCQYLPEVQIAKRVCREFSTRVEALTGAIKDKPKSKARTDMIRRFQEGKIDYLVCQQKTGGVGVDLYAARNSVVYSFGHSSIDFEQMVSRMDVMGQAPPQLFAIFCLETIDEDKREAILSKRSITDVILETLKRRQRT